MARVLLEHLEKRWPGSDRNTLTDIHMQIPDGAFWVLVGASGCGKSTILRLIAGLEQPTGGQIYLDDRCVTQVPARERDVAMVFQNYALYPHMTVAENLGFGLKMRGMPRTELGDRVLAVAKSLAIDHLLHRKPPQLSGGQQQRVALGRAIARSARVFLLDEPLSNLDAQLRDETRAELKLLHQRLGTTTLYVTHDQTEAMTLGDRLVVLDRGQIRQIGTPLEVYQKPQNLMVAQFLGTPPMNILDAVYSDGRFRLGGASIPCPEMWQRQLPSVPSEPVKLGIRPEHLALCSADGDRSGQLWVQRVLVEPLGSEQVVRAALAGEPSQRLHLRVGADVTVPEHFGVCAPPEHWHLFDGRTGQRLM